MRIYLHIGLEHVGADRLQKVMADKREQMIAKGVLKSNDLGQLVNEAGLIHRDTRMHYVLVKDNECGHAVVGTPSKNVIVGDPSQLSA